MDKHSNQPGAESLPACATEYIGKVTGRMRYRRRVRRDVEAELTAHFEDALKDCTTAEEKERKARELIEQFGDAKLLAVLCRRAKRRCRPVWQKVLVRGLQALGLLLLYLVMCTLPLWIGKPTVNVDYVEWLNERWRPDGQDIENARHYYDEAAGLYVAPPQGLEGKAYAGSWTLSDYNETDMRSLEPWLAQNKTAFDMLRRGAGTAHYWPAYDPGVASLRDPNLMEETMGVLSNYKQLIRSFARQVACEAYEGKVGEALDDCLVARRLARHLQGKGLLIEQMVGIAIEGLGLGSMFNVLQNSDIPPATLDRIQKELVSRFDPARRVIDLSGEKALWHDQIQRSFTDDGEGGGHALPKGFPYAAGNWKHNLTGIFLFDYPDRRETVAMVEQYFERAQKRLSTPPNVKGRREPDDLGQGPPENMLLALLTPAYGRLTLQAWRLKTHETAAVATLAILRYKSEKGRYPANLRALVETGYLQGLPDDPFGEGPLSYEKTPSGFLLYSWGENLRDDGGQMGTGKDGKPRMWAGNGDWVFWPAAQDLD